MLVAFLTTLAQMCRILFFLAVGYMFNKLRLVPKTAEPVAVAEAVTEEVPF